MNIQDKAKARITKWKKQLKKGHEIAEMTGVREEVVSRIFNGRGMVPKQAYIDILAAKEPSK